MYQFITLANKQEKVIAGLMSGTSVDGVDVAIVSIRGFGQSTKVELKHFGSVPFEPEIREAIFTLFQPDKATVDFVCHLNFLLGKVFAEAVMQVVEESGYNMDQIDLISSHGQTAYHIPIPQTTGKYQTMSTLQIGEPAVIAEHTGRPVVADFRVRDMAAGGQGAPLVPYVDNLLFAHPTTGRVLTNIGGIANITILPAGADSSRSTAFDTGPGNMVIDAIVQLGTDNRERYDKDGQYASQGKVDTAWLDELMADDYFAMKPPKSTGREKYTKQFAIELWEEGKRRGLSFYDITATVTEWTAYSIAKSLHDFVLPNTAIAEMIVSGGGSYNPVLMASLANRLPGVRVAPIDDYGMPSDAKEAIAFAILGNECVHGVCSNVPTATGASKPVILGKLIQA